MVVLEVLSSGLVRPAIDAAWEGRSGLGMLDAYVAGR